MMQNIFDQLGVKVPLTAAHRALISQLLFFSLTRAHHVHRSCSRQKWLIVTLARSWSFFYLKKYLKISAFDHDLQVVQELWRSGHVSQSMGPTDTCLQFVPLWNFLVGLFLIKLSAWFPVMSIQLSR